MNELQEIVQGMERLDANGERGVLATVINVKGSAYRRAGARMLFNETGREAGFVSAACLAGDLLDRARSAMETGCAQLVTYDNSSPEAVLFGMSQGCTGLVEILLEPITPFSGRRLYHFLKTTLAQRKPAVLATVFAADVDAPASPGDHAMLSEEGAFDADIEDLPLVDEIRRDAQDVLEQRKPLRIEYASSAGIVRTFFDYIPEPVPLLLMGAGPEAIPLARFAQELGWIVTVTDYRASLLRPEFFPGVDRLFECPVEEVPDRYEITERTNIVVTYHQFDAEASALRQTLSGDARYIGMLGPRSKRELLLARLESDGFTPSDEQLMRLYSPVGLDIGSETPTEIALAVVAEIRATIAGREGGQLRRREGAIH